MKGYNKTHFKQIVSDLEDLQEELQEVISGVEEEYDRLGYARFQSKGHDLEDEISSLEDFNLRLEDLIDDMHEMTDCD